jgi:hypothetical protein
MFQAHNSSNSRPTACFYAILKKVTPGVLAIEDRLHFENGNLQNCWQRRSQALSSAVAQVAELTAVVDAFASRALIKAREPQADLLAEDEGPIAEDLLKLKKQLSGARATIKLVTHKTRMVPHAINWRKLVVLLPEAKEAAAELIQNMVTDAQYVYVSPSVDGVFRGVQPGRLQIVRVDTEIADTDGLHVRYRVHSRVSGNNARRELQRAPVEADFENEGPN